jgi:hypothetical protein
MTALAPFLSASPTSRSVAVRYYLNAVETG